MNIERIDQVISSIKGEIEQTKTLGFNMDYFISQSNEQYCLDRSNRGCGTVACIAGHAYALKHQEMPIAIVSDVYDKSPGEYWSIPAIAREWLELDENTANDLFYARLHDESSGHIFLGEVEPAEAIQVLEHLKATGEVDWSIIL